MSLSCNDPVTFCISHNIHLDLFIIYRKQYFLWYWANLGVQVVKIFVQSDILSLRHLSGPLICPTNRLLSADKSVYASLISVHLRVMELRVITDKSFPHETVAESCDWCCIPTVIMVTVLHFDLRVGGKFYLTLSDIWEIESVIWLKYCFCHKKKKSIDQFQCFALSRMSLFPFYLMEIFYSDSQS